MIPFVAAGGLLIALGFLFGGYEIANSAEGEKPSLAYGFGSIGHIIAGTNSLTNLPSGGLLQYLGAVLFTLGGLAFMFLVPALAGYISFAIADRPGIAPGFHRRRGRGLRRRRLHRRHRRRADRRLHRTVDKPDRRPAVASRLDAGGDHPVVRIAGGRPVDVPAARPSAGGNHVGPDQLARRHVRQFRHHSRRHPRPDDVLRPRRPGQQGRLRIRDRRPQCRRPRVAAHHGRGDGRGHGSTAGDGAGLNDSAEGCSPSRSGRTAGPLGFSVRRSSQRGRSRSPRPIRCVSSRR